MSKNFTIASGLSANLPEDKVPGRVLITEDTNDVYIDLDDSTRIQTNAEKASTLRTPRYIDGLTFNGSANITRFAICNSASTDNPKVVTSPNFVNINGAIINIKFTNSNTADPSPLYLKVNGSNMYPIILGNVDYKLSNKCIYTFVFYNNQYYIVSTELGTIAGCSISDIMTSSSLQIIPKCSRGTWEPTCSGLSISESSGNYVRIGSYVQCWFKFIINLQSGITAGGITFYGLPYKHNITRMMGSIDPSSYNTFCGVGTTKSDNSTFDKEAVILLGDNTQFTITVDGGHLTGSIISNILSTTSVEINGQFSYYTNDNI